MGQAGMKNNWKRNTRYMGVFAVLAAVFCMIVVQLVQVLWELRLNLEPR